MNKHAFWRGIICGVVLAFVGRAAVADTIITYDLANQTMTIDGVTPPVVGHVGTPQDGGDGRRLFQGIWFDGQNWKRLSTRDGIATIDEPGGLAQLYENEDAAPSLFPFEMPIWAANVSHVGNTVTIYTSAAIRAPGDFNGDGATSVQDIFDFLVTQPTAGEVFAFLEAWYS